MEKERRNRNRDRSYYQTANTSLNRKLCTQEQEEIQLYHIIVEQMITAKRTVMPLNCIFNGNAPLSGVRFAYKLALQFPGICLLSTYSGSEIKVAVTSKIELCRFYPKCSKSCNRLHLCKNYIQTDNSQSSSCKYGINCWFEHNFSSKHNAPVIKQLGLDKIPASLLKRFIVLLNDETNRMLRLCADLNCKRNCKKLHGCYFYLSQNICRNGDRYVPEEELQRYIKLIYRDRSVFSYKFGNLLTMSLLFEERININNQDQLDTLKKCTADSNDDLAGVESSSNWSESLYTCINELSVNNKNKLWKNGNEQFRPILNVTISQIYPNSFSADTSHSQVVKLFMLSMDSTVASVISVKKISNSILSEQFIRSLTHKSSDNDLPQSEDKGASVKKLKQVWTFVGAPKYKVVTYAFENIIGHIPSLGVLNLISSDHQYLHIMDAKEAHRFTTPDDYGFRYMLMVRVVDEFLSDLSNEKDQVTTPSPVHRPIIDPASCNPEFIIKYNYF
ncbi:hypothetical protein GJ496_005875 [Pomphorhynchus laevis]|nr:hypothetical protein GJ496_005875 [Pomphorhynchus laevis]